MDVVLFQRSGEDFVAGVVHADAEGFEDFNGRPAAAGAAALVSGVSAARGGGGWVFADRGLAAWVVVVGVMVCGFAGVGARTEGLLCIEGAWRGG